MKSYYPFLCLLVVSVYADPVFDDELREIFEFIKQQMPCGFPTIGVPPLAPYKRDFVEFDFGNPGIEFAGDLANLRIDGLNDFYFTELTYARVFMRAKFDVHFNAIKVFSQYTAKNRLEVLGLPIPLTGAGDLDLTFENIRFSGGFNLRPTLNNGLRMYAFKSHLELGHVTSRINGVMNSQSFSTFFNSFVEEFFRLLFEDNQEKIDKAVGDLLVPMVNEQLKDVSLTELLEFVFGPGSKVENLPICEAW